MTLTEQIKKLEAQLKADPCTDPAFPEETWPEVLEYALQIIRQQAKVIADLREALTEIADCDGLMTKLNHYGVAQKALAALDGEA